MFKIGDKVKLVDTVKNYAADSNTKPDVHGWFTILKPHPEADDWWFLKEAPSDTPFHEKEMIKAKKPIIIII